MTNPICFKCNKLGYIKCECPLLKEKKEVKDEIKKKKTKGEHSVHSRSTHIQIHEKKLLRKLRICG